MRVGSDSASTPLTAGQTMNETIASLAARLQGQIVSGGPSGVAVSGGIDSLLLAHLAHAALGGDAYMFHAVSPAVPADASARVRRHAEAFGWKLRIIDAGEFADPRYLANPVNRCFFCKQNLYGRIRESWTGALLSGNNTDDLADYRPGLDAAAEHGVRHPYIVAGIGKAVIRRIAAALGLEDIADLPAQPCLASRVTTGIPIDADSLRVVDELESVARRLLGAITLRCRIRPAGLQLELERSVLAALSDAEQDALHHSLVTAAASAGRVFLGMAPYRRSGDAVLARNAGFNQLTGT